MCVCGVCVHLFVCFCAFVYLFVVCAHCRDENFEPTRKSAHFSQCNTRCQIFFVLFPAFIFSADSK